MKLTKLDWSLIQFVHRCVDFSISGNANTYTHTHTLTYHSMPLSIHIRFPKGYAHEPFVSFPSFCWSLCQSAINLKHVSLCLCMCTCTHPIQNAIMNPSNLISTLKIKIHSISHRNLGDKWSQQPDMESIPFCQFQFQMYQFQFYFLPWVGTNWNIYTE